MPELRVLASFAAVVEEGSISAGARRAGVTQPAMTRQIQGLESELGVRLLIRGEGGLRTTPAGARFYERVTNLLTQAENVIGRTKQEAEQHRLALHVIAPSATIHYGIVPFLRHRDGAGPILDCESADPFRVFDVAHTRGADLGISTRPPRPEWSRFALGIGLLYAHVRKDHEIARRTSIDIAELIEHPLILLTPNNAARRVFDESIPADAATDAEHIVVRHPAIAEALVHTTASIAVLTDMPKPGAAGPLITKDGEPLSVPLIAGWDPHNSQAHLIEDTMKRMRVFLAGRVRRQTRRLQRDPRP